MNRRNFFTWMAAVVAWLWTGKAEAESEPISFTQHWDPFETIQFTFHHKGSPESRGSATLDVMHGHMIQPGAELAIECGEQSYTIIVDEVL